MISHGKSSIKIQFTPFLFLFVKPNYIPEGKKLSKISLILGLVVVYENGSAWAGGGPSRQVNVHKQLSRHHTQVECECQWLAVAPACLPPTSSSSSELLLQQRPAVWHLQKRDV